MPPKRRRVLANDFEASSSTSAQVSYRAAMLHSSARNYGTSIGSSNQSDMGFVQQSSSSNGLLQSPDYIDLGSCVEVCEFCGATFWFCERVLLWVSADSKICEPVDIDRYISAELPNEDVNPVLHRIVTDCMLHGPCGLANASSPCMKKGVCSKKFPKSYEANIFFDSKGYVHYKRPANGHSFIKNGVPLDNGFVVPYDVEEKMTNESRPRPYLLLTIRDCSNQQIKVNLWVEIATSLERYNKPAIEVATNPKIIGMTALKVKKYHDRIKLQSSAATYVYLDPISIETQTLLQIYDSPANPNPSTNQEAYLSGSSSENVTTIKEILTKTSNEIMGRTFIIHGEICNIINKEWCYVACPNCNKGLIKSEEEWFCPKHDTVNNPIYSFRVSATISDGTGCLDATIFNDAVTQLVGDSCNTILDSDQQIDLKHTPPVLAATIGKQAKFRLQVQRNDRTGGCRCTIDQVTYTPGIKAPITPQQQQTVSINEADKTVKRRLQLPD